MSNRTITYLTDVALLTVVVQRGQGEAILEAARDVGATTGAVSYYVKGLGTREFLGKFALAVDVEREVFSLLVSSDQQDIILDHIYRAGKLDTPGVGYIYITPLEKVAAYVPENLKKQLEKREASVG